MRGADPASLLPGSRSRSEQSGRRKRRQPRSRFHRVLGVVPTRASESARAPLWSLAAVGLFELSWSIEHKDADCMPSGLAFTGLSEPFRASTGDSMTTSLCAPSLAFTGLQEPFRSVNPGSAVVAVTASRLHWLLGAVPSEHAAALQPSAPESRFCWASGVVARRFCRATTVSAIASRFYGAPGAASGPSPTDLRRPISRSRLYDLPEPFRAGMFGNTT